ncbi:transporter [Streptomyces sp. H28]|uniref:transporter n=1 Tax=Streptomyces sp. H28 TaxID=2775865 RepID=UPI00177EB3DF|nr:transporter [Streptomyces sp. H28]MBD9730657.1 transporter [Streptomyces sp. H28]
MRETLFLLADLWMIFAGYFYGWTFIRRYGNYLLGLEWMVVATSGSNFLLWSLLGARSDSVLYDLAYFLDAFSRSVGITLILVLGLMKVTHRYKPSRSVDVVVFGVAIVAALFLRPFHGADLHTDRGAFWVSGFYVVVNLLTATFLCFFVKRLWGAGARWPAVWTGLVTVAGTTIAITYDFFPLPFDDANRTIFYTAALATWGTQGFVYFRAYRALHDRNAALDSNPARMCRPKPPVPPATGT